MFLLDTLADKGTVNKCYINSGMHKWSSELNNKAFIKDTIANTLLINIALIGNF